MLRLHFISLLKPFEQTDHVNRLRKKMCMILNFSDFLVFLMREKKYSKILFYKFRSLCI